MPQACTRMRTCPAGGCGISRSTISKSAPGFGTCTTFIFAIEILRSLFWIRGRQLDARLGQTATYYAAAEPASAEQDRAESGKKFCNDFRGDAQALQLTRARLPRTMRHRLNQVSVRFRHEISPLPLPSGCSYKKRRKGEYKADLPCLLTRHSRSHYRIPWMRNAPFLARFCWITTR